MALYFTSDEHYGHARIIDHCNRPFKTVEEMNEVILERHNQVIGPDDDVFHLGDMFWKSFGKESAEKVLNNLNGRYHFYIRGNHEELLDEIVGQRLIRCGDIYNFSPGKHQKRVILCHYPIKEWPGKNKKSVHLFGHCHGSVVGEGLSMDVGVDCTNFYPISLDEVRERLERKQADAESIREQVEERSS